MVQADDCTTIVFLCGVGRIQFGDFMPELSQVSLTMETTGRLSALL